MPKKLSEVRYADRVRTVNDKPSKTVQSDVFRTEIRHIMAKYKATGIVEHLKAVDLQFRDVTEFEDFADLMFQSKQAEKVFLALPSKVREVFHHDVAEWLDAAHDRTKFEALRPQFEELGVLKPEAEPIITPLVPQAGDRRKPPPPPAPEPEKDSGTPGPRQQR